MSVFDVLLAPISARIDTALSDTTVVGFLILGIVVAIASFKHIARLLEVVGYEKSYRRQQMNAAKRQRKEEYYRKRDEHFARKRLAKSTKKMEQHKTYDSKRERWNRAIGLKSR